jgi:uncharacterized protein (TIGR02466 family)
MLHHFFPTPIYEVDLNVNPEQFKTYLNFIEDLNWSQDFDTWGNPHGYTTTVDYKEDVLSLDPLFSLATLIDIEMSSFVFNNIGISPAAHYIERTTSWANKQGFGDYISTHLHSNSHYSGVLYLKTPEDSGDIHFINEQSTWSYPGLEYNLHCKNKINIPSVSFTPTTQKLLLFPSFLKHFVDKSQSKELRYSLSFNYFVKGEYIDGMSYLNLK